MISKELLYGALISVNFAAGGIFLQVVHKSAHPKSWMDLIIGPLGALVILALLSYILIKYIQKKDTKIDELNDMLMKEKDAQIEMLKKQGK